jgi:hypothetical protein
MLNSNSVFSSLENLRGIVRKAKSASGSEVADFQLRLFRSKSGQIVNDFSVKHSRSFSFFAVAHNDQGYPYLAVCGQSTCRQAKR